MNLLHFLFDLGSIGGPWFISLLEPWYALTGCIPAGPYSNNHFAGYNPIKLRFPDHVQDVQEVSAEKKTSFWSFLKDPKIWFFGYLIGISCVTVFWALLGVTEASCFTASSL